MLGDIRTLGHAVKLDTNGTWPRRTRDLLATGLVDYLAADVKAAPGPRSQWLCGCERQGEGAMATLTHAVRTGVPCEARTVLVDGVHDRAALSWIAKTLAGQGVQRWRLRDVVHTGPMLDADAHLVPRHGPPSLPRWRWPSARASGQRGLRPQATVLDDGYWSCVVHQVRSSQNGTVPSLL